VLDWSGHGCRGDNVGLFRPRGNNSREIEYLVNRMVIYFIELLRLPFAKDL
jgi:hypothetical protein